MVTVASLWSAPAINPINQKARTIPVLNPVNKYGRVFFFSWFGFFIAFWSWYAFTPLLSLTIKKDLNLTTEQIANTNIAALTGTLLVRFVAGPLCDRFGPRWTYIMILLAGSIPTAMAGLVNSWRGLLALRFFVGILGGTFVPCQVWSTGFFDKNVVGSANALIGGWGNSGGGITYFLMPVIYDSLRTDQGLTSNVAWRVAFIVPFILIVSTAAGMLFLCDDTPTGKWSERHAAARQLPQRIIDVPVTPSDRSLSEKDTKEKPDLEQDANNSDVRHGQVLDAAQGEVVVAPTAKNMLRILASPQTLFHAATYACSFGGELAINSYLGAYYLKNFPYLGQTGAGRWAAMFGLLNVVTRPLGGIIADILYKYTSSLWVKKMWIVFVGIVSGAMLIAIGLTDPNSESMMFGLIAGMAIFLEAGNGANFALVPHVHPQSNGILSGIVGAVGNLGGVIYAIVFRFHGTDYAESFWITGVMIIGLNLVLCWVNPIPKSQR
ncbi:Putative nitrate transporter NarK/NarU, major facilitator superfamily, MFS transporter superfamily [Septoria linicola]|uniref:Nitrate/nitrite transporter n=1 Tax=Septoria linicola TaxID=215465 RepID=A0A9Q9ATR0_9PEZI|nr:putative major facilitator superfamily, MFS transporter superfamily [Septoria linicola]USW54980.1 Putative nitrate transporter NarK/NarU, major facilitator superfamily, MFS transporter superfamily [Septoria linicola]